MWSHALLRRFLQVVYQHVLVAKRNETCQERLSKHPPENILSKVLAWSGFVSQRDERRVSSRMRTNHEGVRSDGARALTCGGSARWRSGRGCKSSGEVEKRHCPMRVPCVGRGSTLVALSNLVIVSHRSEDRVWNESPFSPVLDETNRCYVGSIVRFFGM